MQNIAAHNSAAHNSAQQTFDRQLTFWADEGTALVAAQAAKQIDRSLSWYLRLALQQQLVRDGYLRPTSGAA